MTESVFHVPNVPVATTSPTSFTHAVTTLELIDNLRKQLETLKSEVDAGNSAIETLVSNVNEAVDSAVAACQKLSTDAATMNSATATALESAAADLAASRVELASAMSSASAALAAAQQVSTAYQQDVARQDAAITSMGQSLTEQFTSMGHNLSDQISTGLATKVDKNRLRFDVKDFGAVGDGVTDDSVAVKAAIAASKEHHGIVFFGAGLYRITSPITIPIDGGVEGISISDNNGDTTYGLFCDFNPDDFDGYAVYASYNAFFSNILIRGTGKGNGINARGAVVMYNVSLRNWNNAIYADDLYYGYFYIVRGYHNNTFFYSNFCHNVNFYGPRVSCLNAAGTTAGKFLDGRNSRCEVHVFGGSIEGYQDAFDIPSPALITCEGTYFEANNPVTGNGAQVFNAQGGHQIAITAIGCWVDMGNTWRFCNVWNNDGVTTKMNVFGAGNFFYGGTTNTGVGYMWYGGDSAVNLSLFSDIWNTSHGDYVQEGANWPGHSLYTMPFNPYH